MLREHEEWIEKLFLFWGFWELPTLTSPTYTLNILEATEGNMSLMSSSSQASRSSWLHMLGSMGHWSINGPVAMELLVYGLSKDRAQLVQVTRKCKCFSPLTIRIPGIKLTLPGLAAAPLTTELSQRYK